MAIGVVVTVGGVGIVLSIESIGRVAYRDQPAQAARVRLDEGEEANRAYAPIRGCVGAPEAAA